MHHSPPSQAVLSLPRRVFEGTLPASLGALFRCLDAWTTPIPVDVLQRELEAVELSLDEIRAAVASDPLTYVRTLVHTGPAYEALIMCWLPSQHSPVHDHGGSACAVRVVSGAAVETVYTVDGAGLASPVSQSIFARGSVVCSFDADVHSLANALTGVAAGESLVTLHIYSPALVASRKYPLKPLRRDASSRA
jgi:cysteine dioxygenase